MLDVQKKRKILNDPLYGFITIPSPLIFDIIEQPAFQRLRRITQLGLTYMVYPGAIHTRFQHSLGSMFLVQRAVEVLQQKGHSISAQEMEAVQLAVLLHDIGHGPFSHTLECSIISRITHEQMSYVIMHKLNDLFPGKLEMAMQIFRGDYHKSFLHQLVSSQLDVDRLDYLKRDSFFTGVSEGVIGSERIISMMDLVDDNLVVEYKGIYSIEKFIVSRRLMYWQVYMHKTVLSAEFLLINILKRAKELVANGHTIQASDSFAFLLAHNYGLDDFYVNEDCLTNFLSLDDIDVLSAVKAWCKSDDFLLSYLCTSLINRKLYKIELQAIPFNPEHIKQVKDNARKIFPSLSSQELEYIVFSGQVTNHAYNTQNEQINILYKNGVVKDIMDTSEQLNTIGITKEVYKYYLCYPKDCRPIA